jgi:predicted ATPase/DNA-binding SARP family transcriptional activator
VEFRVLGPLVVSGDDGEIPVGAAKQRALLELLLLRRGELVLTSVLVDELWGERPPATAVKTVQVYVAELRKLLGKGLIETRPGGYLLCTNPNAVDAVRFEELIAGGRDLLAAGEAGAAGERLGEALALWRGPPLGEFQYESFARDEIRRLGELRLVAQELLLEAELALGHHAEAVPELEALIREEPLRENLRRLLMLALYRSGRQADALGAYRDARATLLDELGLDPSESLQQLETAILNHDRTLDLAAPPSSTRQRTNLPMPATSFVGRERELDELSPLLHDGVRLLTLTGPGGVGKTRLALRAVSDATDAYPNGVWWVPLASVRDPGLLLSSVALALGVTEQPGRPLAETLSDALSAGRTLLLLDNLEQLLPGAATPVATLRDAGATSVVVTSRERLQLSGEHVYPVAPLEASEAAELFSARTAALGLDAGDAGSVAELCSRLDNLPLALELAAARTGLLAPAELLSRLGGRLDRLRGGRDVDPRQQTLRATIAWSHDLLDAPERELFARLAVFAGGATLDAVEAVCDADLDVLASLIDKSLVRRSGERESMLETIREFASEQLDADPDVDELRDRHARYYLALAEASDRESRGPGQAEAFARFAAERDNLRAAFEWLLDRDPAAALRLVAAHWWFWYMRGHFHEGREMLRAALERASPEPTEARASALVGGGLLAYYQADRREAYSLHGEGLACARAVGSTANVIRALCYLSHNPELGREERIRLGEEAIAQARVYGDRWLLGLATGGEGFVMASLGELERASGLYEEGYRLCRGVGDLARTAFFANNLGWIALCAGDTVKARAWLEESLELARRTNNDADQVGATVNLGWVELLESNLDLACERFETGAALARRQGRTADVAEAIWGLAQVAAARGAPDRAAGLAGAAYALGMPVGFAPAASIPFARHLEDARTALGEHAWKKAWDDGAELNLDAALTLALEQ